MLRRPALSEYHAYSGGLSGSLKLICRIPQDLVFTFMFSSRSVVDDRLDLVELFSDLTLGDFHIVAVL